MVNSQGSRGPLSFFRNLKTATKLLSGFLVVSLLMVGVGVLGISKLASAQANLKNMYDNSLAAIAQLGSVTTDFTNTRIQALNVALDADPAARSAAVAKIKDLDAAIDTSWADYTSTDMTGREKFRDAFIADLAAYRKIRDEQMLPLALDSKLAEFIAVRDSLATPLATATEADLTGLEGVENDAAAKTLAESQSAYSNARTLIIAIIVVALVASIGLAIGIGRMIAGPLAKTVVVLEGLAEGRLDLQLDVHTKDEVGQMASALNRAMAKLRDAMNLMGNNAQGLASASEELSAVSSQMKGSADDSALQAQSVSAAAEQVSMNVHTVAAGTEEMSASIREIAKNTNDASGVASRAVEIAGTASTTVATLGESSAEIGNVIKVDRKSVV